MRLTPLEIRSQKFRRRPWGFDPPEVEAFLEGLAQDFELLQREVHELRSDVGSRDAEIGELRERDRAMKEAMLSTARFTEDMKQNAQKEADLVVAGAEAEAELIVRSAQARLVRIVAQIDELKRQRIQFETTLRSAISAHTRLVDELVSGEDVVALGAHADGAVPTAFEREMPDVMHRTEPRRPTTLPPPPPPDAPLRGRGVLPRE